MLDHGNSIYVSNDHNHNNSKILYIVTELMNNGELFNFIKQQKFSEDLARHYFKQLLTGLEECHKKGIIHRNLKPENILIDDNFILKIASFGNSTKVSAS